MRNAALAAALAALLLLTGCDGVSREGRQIEVVVTTSIWGDVVANIVGDDGEVEVLIPRGADAHEFEPTSREIAALHGADLVLANGLGLEQGLSDTIESANSDGANVYEVAADLTPLPLGSEGDGEDLDPHVWFDPLRVATAARLIAERLADVDDSIDWQRRAAGYAETMMTADEEIQRELMIIPEDDRKLVTNHEALGYFADRYRFDIIGVVIPGGSTLGDPSSAELAALVEEMKRHSVDVIFAETTRPTRLAEAVAAETGEPVQVVELYTESLGQLGSGADTLAGMLLANARSIAGALGPGG